MENEGGGGFIAGPRPDLSGYLQILPAHGFLAMLLVSKK
jgi:hypothetical protein